MPIIIHESDMNFGPFQEENCFYIEKSIIYNKLKQGLRIAEFVLVQPNKNKLLVIEAKSSTPMRETSEQRFNEFIDEIAEKLLNAFNLILSLYHNRHKYNENELPDNFKKITFNNIEIVFVLVINGHKDEWLDDLNNCLKKKLKASSKIWSTKVIAINDRIAKEYSLIVDKV